LKAISRVREEVSQSLPQYRDFLRFGRSAAALLAWFGAVLLWLIFGPFAIYQPIGYLDPWFYTGYFTNFSYLLLHRGFVYYVSRLPWIIPGRIAFSIANPEVASLLLCAGILTVSGISVYWIVRWHYGQPAALLAVLALITNAYFMGTADWHYPDGAAIAYATVALALYLRPHGSPSWNGFLAAVALTLSAFTNFAGAPMVLSVLLIPLWRWRHFLKKLLQQGVCALAGVAVTTLVLMAVSKRVLGDVRVFKPQLDQWLYALHNPGYLSGTWGSGTEFLLTAVRLFTPAFLLLFGPVLLIAVRRPAVAAWPVYAAMTMCCFFYAFQEFVLHRAGLRVHYVSSYMLVLVSCFVGISLGELWNRNKASLKAMRAAAVALAILALALPFVYGALRPLPAPLVWVLLASLGVAAIVLVLLPLSRLSIQYAACALVLIEVSAGPAMDLGITSGLGERKILHGSNLSGGRRADSFQCLMALEDYVKSNIDPQRNLIFWWDRDESPSDLFASAEALFVSGHVDVTKELASSSARLYPSNTSLVHLTEHPERLQTRIQLLASRGLGVENESRTEMSYAGKRFTVELQDLAALSGFR
jgi:hypothetical protein